MNSSTFDTLTRSIMTVSSRRRMLAQLVAALPTAGALTALLDGPEASAAHPVERIQRRRAHHRKRARRRQDQQHDQQTSDNGGGNNGNGGNNNGGGGGNLGDSDCLQPFVNYQPTNLQQAINNANPFGNLVLCAGEFQAPGLSISKNLSLIGSGSSPDSQSRTVLIGASASGVLGISSGNVFISNLAISGANGDIPAIGIEAGSVTLAAVVVEGNTAGGIVNLGGTLRLTQGTQVLGNGSDAEGGGILHRGGTTIVETGCSIRGNRATDGGGIFDATATAGDVQLEDTLIVTENTPNNCSPAGTVPNCLS